MKDTVGFSSTEKLDENTTSDKIGTNWLYYSHLQLSDILKLNSLLETHNLVIFLLNYEYCIKKEIFEKNNLKLIGIDLNTDVNNNIIKNTKPKIVLYGSSVIKSKTFTSKNIHYTLNTSNKDDYFNQAELTYAGIIIKDTERTDIDNCELVNNHSQNCMKINILDISNNKKYNMTNTTCINCKLHIRSCPLVFLEDNKFKNMYIYLWCANTTIYNNTFEEALWLDLFNCEMSHITNNKFIDVNSYYKLISADYSTKLYFNNNDMITKSVKLCDEEFKIFNAERYSTCHVFNNKFITDNPIGIAGFGSILNINNNKFSKDIVEVRCYYGEIKHKDNFNNNVEVKFEISDKDIIKPDRILVSL